jgi:transcriptional regulator with XRE-family HTH domain
MSTTEAINTSAAEVPTWTLGERLTKAREHAGVDIEEMAHRLGVSGRTIRNYENQAVRITRATIIAYATETRVPIDWLEDDDPSRSRCFREARPPNPMQQRLFALAA